MRIFFARHGQSEANLLKVFSNRGWKHPLTAMGRQQAHELAARLRDRNVAAVFTSPLRRAVESAQIVAEQLRVPFEIEPALVEYDVGILEDSQDPAGWQALDEVERLWAQGSLDARLPGGESYSDIRARFVPFLRPLIERFDDRADASLVLIGHGGTYRHGLPLVLDNVSREFASACGLGNGNFVETEWRDGSLRCVFWDGRAPA